MRYHIQPSQLQGNITIPPSKSHTLRAILFASFAKGKSQIHDYLISPDTNAMIQACQLFGANIKVEPKILTIIGNAGQPKIPTHIIDAGNSGQVLRFIGAIAALTSDYTIITGDDSVRNQRPIQPLLDGLTQLQVFAVSAQGDGTAPIIIQGPLPGGTATIDGEDSQPVSGLLIASAFAKNNTTIYVRHPGETPWIDLTLDWFRRLGIDCQQQGYTQYKLTGQATYAGFDYTVPGDFSSCAFPLIGALITGSHITLNNLDMNDIQGDKALIFTLQAMGANLKIDEEQKKLQVYPSKNMIGKTINVNQYIDALPVLAVMGCFSSGETTLTGARIARKKESDRISAITQELKKMGAHIIEKEEGLKIYPSVLKGAHVSSRKDHRIAMALAVAAMAAQGETMIDDIECVDKSYPNFAESLQSLGLSIEIAP